MRRALGSTGVDVNAIGLGTWPLSRPGRPSRSQAIEVIRTAVEAGVDFIDTADCYAVDDSEFGYGECLVNEALGQIDRRHVRVATKVGFTRPNGVWVADGRPESIKRRCHESLARLGIERIFLYQLHGPDERVPLEESVGAMAELKAEGKVQHLGLSRVDASQLAIAQGITRIQSVQNACNPWQQEDLANGLIAECARTEVAYFPFNPVGGIDQHRQITSEPQLRSLASKYGASPYCVLLHWLLRICPNVLPIPGASRVSSILDSLQAADLDLGEDDLDKLSSLAPPRTNHQRPC